MQHLCRRSVLRGISLTVLALLFPAFAVPQEKADPRNVRPDEIVLQPCAFRSLASEAGPIDILAALGDGRRQSFVDQAGQGHWDASLRRRLEDQPEVLADQRRPCSDRLVVLRGDQLAVATVDEAVEEGLRAEFLG